MRRISDRYYRKHTHLIICLLCVLCVCVVLLTMWRKVLHKGRSEQQQGDVNVYGAKIEDNTIYFEFISRCVCVTAEKVKISLSRCNRLTRSRSNMPNFLELACSAATAAPLTWVNSDYDDDDDGGSESLVALGLSLPLCYDHIFQCIYQDYLKLIQDYNW